MRHKEVNKLIIKLRKKFVKTSFFDIISQDLFRNLQKIKVKGVCENLFLRYHLKRFFKTHSWTTLCHAHECNSSHKKHPDLKWERTADFDLVQPFATLMIATEEKCFNEKENMNWSVNQQQFKRQDTKKSTNW